ncbi:MAG: hypothetical protein AMXMBFR64_34800 [Myxococcales bacterium]
MRDLVQEWVEVSSKIFEAVRGGDVTVVETLCELRTDLLNRIEQDALRSPLDQIERNALRDAESDLQGRVSIFLEGARTEAAGNAMKSRTVRAYGDR